jgi:hypothetical protein
MRLRSFLLFASLVPVSFVAACGSGGGGTGGPDVIDLVDTAGGDADGGDAGSDGSPETGADAEPDAGPDVGDTAPDSEDVATDVADTDAGEPLRPCEVNADCRGGEVCRAGFCREACTESPDCDDPRAPVCAEGGYCVECVETSDCGAAEICDANACAFFCGSDADCPERTACNTDSGSCDAVECTLDAHCEDEEVCAENVCVPEASTVCTPSATECDGNVLLVCVADGSSQARRTCPEAAPCSVRADGSAACVPVDCVPDSIGCLDLDTAYLCESAESIVEAPCRAGQICFEGVCLVPECVPGTTVCEGEVVVSCGDDGAVASRVACASTPECSSSPGGCACRDGACVPLACRPGSARCVGNASQRCADSGAGYEAPVDCGTDYCVAGECRDRVCEPGTVTCVGETVVDCNDDGTAAVETDCGADAQICVPTDVEGARCIDRACVPSSVSCGGDGVSVVTCDARGASESIVPCDADEYCEAGACVDRVCDPAGAPVCDGSNVLACNAIGSGFDLVAACGAAGCEDGACADPCAAATGNLGCEFWAADLDNYRLTCLTSSECSTDQTCTGGYCTPSPFSSAWSVAIANPNASAATVEVFNREGTRLSTVIVPAGGTAERTMPEATLDNTVIGEAFRITSTLPVTVTQYNPRVGGTSFSNDSSLLLPAREFGTEYMVMSWPTRTDSAVSALRSFYVVVATGEGPTDITTTLSSATEAALSGSPAAFSAGRTTARRLNRGQAMALSSTAVAGGDLTGSTVTGSQPFAVFAGNECANIPVGTNYCDHIEEQLPPIEAWGTAHVVARSAARGSEPDLVRILGSAAGTTISTVPVVPAVDGRTIGRGERLEFRTTQDVVISSTQPVLVGQYLVSSEYPADATTCERFAFATGCAIPADARCTDGRALGDPGFAIVSPLGGSTRDLTLRVQGDAVRNGVAIAAPSGAVLTVDGAAAADPGTTVGAFRVWRVDLAAGTHRIQATQPFVGVQYSYGCGFSYFTTLTR